MVNGKRVLIIIPALNESGSIADVVGEVRGELPGVDVLVVDDGSTDRTAAVAAAAGARVAKLPYNLGVGGAMRLGYRYARDNDYDVAIQIDADGQHDPRYVPKLVDLLDDNVDLVIGARFAGEGDYSVRGPRRWAMVMLSAVLSKVAKTKLTDTTSGFRAANRRVIEMFAGWYPAEYLGDTVETLVHTARRGYKIRQVPVAMRKRMAGTPSHSPAKAMIYLGRAFAVLTLALIRR
ncbi:glycosyltransferase family 2 protein [Micromonospora sp. URMC 105]|uniref:glycosyltransferase family 2 protein n=1 Tax=Micromonospora sp. URMC 105 TaxID=3423413 RepID=UPI003F1B3B6D